MSLSELKGLEVKAAQELYDHPANQLIAGMQVGHIEQLTESIEKIEKVVLASARELPYYAKLATLPGVGRILGMTITLEVGDINEEEYGRQEAQVFTALREIRARREELARQMAADRGDEDEGGIGIYTGYGDR